MASKKPRAGKCGAKLRNSEKRYGRPMYCESDPMKDRTRCRLHGGLTPVGIEAPSFKHGRRSKYAPQRLMPRLEEFLNDDELFSLREEAAMFKAMLAEIVRDLDANGNTETWRALASTKRRFDRLQAAGQEVEARTALLEIFHLIDTGSRDAAKIAEIRRLVRDLRQVVDSERKHELSKQYVIPIREYNYYMGQLFEMLTRHLRDRTGLADVITEYNRLVGHSEGHPAQA